MKFYLLKSKRFWKDLFESHILLKFIKNNYLILSWIVIAGYLYSTIHEIIHYEIFTFFGYAAKYCWTCIPTSVKILTPLEQVMKNHYFIAASAPYVISLFLIFLFTIFFLIYKKKVLFVFALTPFLDTSLNAITIPLSYFTKTSDDFLNLFRIGFIWETLAIMLAPIIMFYILYLNYKIMKDRKV